MDLLCVHQNDSDCRLFKGKNLCDCIFWGLVHVGDCELKEKNKTSNVLKVVEMAWRAFTLDG